MLAVQKTMIRILFLTLLGACSYVLHAQEITIGSDNDKPLEERLVYNHQNTINVGIHTQGFGVGFKLGRIKSIHTTSNWEFEVVSLRSLKEIKTMNATEFFTRPFVYGKLNHVYVMRFGYGQSRLIFGKPYWGGVETRWKYEAGASLALQKPYYYYVVTYHPSSGAYQEITEEQTFDHHDQWVEIIGRAAFSKGLKEIKPSPGVHASLGMSFDFGTTRTRAQSLNLDAIVEYFPLGVSIMDSERNKPLFVTLMLSYNWGTRFNKY